MSKPCKWCGVPIFWKEGDADDRWVPYEDEARNIVHDCPKKPIGVPRPGAETAAAPSTQPAKKVVVQPLSDKEVIFVRKFIHQLKGLTENFE